MPVSALSPNRTERSRAWAWVKEDLRRKRKGAVKALPLCPGPDPGGWANLKGVREKVGSGPRASSFTLTGGEEQS